MLYQRTSCSVTLPRPSDLNGSFSLLLKPISGSPRSAFQTTAMIKVFHKMDDMLRTPQYYEQVKK
eukprot:6412757-Pyramimonas_sp.AAC.1